MLVKSMKQHSRFTGLLQYSLTCCTSFITPPSNVAQNVRELLNLGGIDVLVESLKHHHGKRSFPQLPKL